jgi:hypothetical protein
MELIVYHDENYPTSWISNDHSNKITNYLKSKGFMKCNAEQLAEWMEKSIRENVCPQSVIVFSQDVAPSTVCHSACSSALIRTYLDHGGSVIWIGDMPFYYVGPNPKRKFKMLKNDSLREGFIVLKDKEGKLLEKWGRRGCFGVLGVGTVYVDFPSSTITISKKGKAVGLRTVWYSNRPIIIKGLSNIRGKTAVLGTTKPQYISSAKKIVGYREEEAKTIPISSTMDLMSKLLGVVSAAGAAFAAFTSAFLAGVTTLLTLLVTSAVFCSVLSVYWLFRLREEYVSAWSKNFNPQYSSSGFTRIWDFSPSRITDEMLEELYTITISKVTKEVLPNCGDNVSTLYL